MYEETWILWNSLCVIFSSVILFISFSAVGKKIENRKVTPFENFWKFGKIWEMLVLMYKGKEWRILRWIFVDVFELSCLRFLNSQNAALRNLMVNHDRTFVPITNFQGTRWKTNKHCQKHGWKFLIKIY